MPAEGRCRHQVRSNGASKATGSSLAGLPTGAWTEALATHSPAVRSGIRMRPRMVCFGGGLPLRHEGRLLGGLGVSGGSDYHADDSHGAAYPGSVSLPADAFDQLRDRATRRAIASGASTSS